MKFILFALSAMWLLVSCSQDDFIPVKVTYRVTLTDSNTVSIQYNSDYYYASGIRKPVIFTSEGLSWDASHTADSEETYYIRVDYLEERKPETRYIVKVIFNDTLTVDSVFYTHSVPTVELQGPVRY